MKTPSHLVLLITLTLAWLTTGCGFHLRGSYDLPPSASPLYIETRSIDLSEHLRLILATSGVRLVEKPAAARLILRIIEEQWDTRTLSVDSRGKVVESELHYRVDFDVVSPSGETHIERQSVDMVRALHNPDVEVLGKRQEEALLRSDMERDMANRIVYRLRAQLR